MSLENVRLFYEKAKHDEKLHGEYTRVMEKEQEKLPDSLIQLAEEFGFRFNEQDLNAFAEEVLEELIEKGELSDEEMEAASGGRIITGIDYNRNAEEDQMVFIQIEPIDPKNREVLIRVPTPPPSF